MKLLQAKLRFYKLVAWLVLLTACTSPGYNDNPSQQISTARLGCLEASEFFAVYFSVHVKPSNETQGGKVTRQQFRSYCQDVPTPGKVFFTADLVGESLRQTPLSIHIVEQDLAGLDASRAENFKDLRTVLEIAPKIYTNGVVELSFEADKAGYYAIYLIRGSSAAASDQDSLRIPLNIGVDSDITLTIVQTVILLGIVLGLALVGRVALRYGRKRTRI